MKARSSDYLLVRRLVTHALVPFTLLPMLGAVVMAALGQGLAVKGLVLASGVIVVTYSLTILLHPLIRDVVPQAAMGMAFAIYSIKIAMFTALFFVPDLHKYADLRWFALGMAPAILLWPFVHAFIVRSVRMPIFDLGETR